MFDFFCGLGGASEGFLAEGWECIGYDNERHDYGSGGYPGELRLKDVREVHGREVADAAFLWFSPPCTEFSYMAMPWSRAKQIVKALRTGDVEEFPEGYAGSMSLPQLTELFYACWRIQIEASHAAGRYIPMIVENVRGAQPWVGRAKANYGSFLLWGDVAMVGRRIVRPDLKGEALLAPVRAKLKGGDRNKNREMEHAWTHSFADQLDREQAAKVPGFRFDGSGGSFQTASVKVSMRSWSDYGLPGYQPQGFNVDAAKRYREAIESGREPEPAWVKEFGLPGEPDPHGPAGSKNSGGTKQPGIGGTRNNGKGDAWFQDGAARHGSKSDSRKAASAMIAKIPTPLSRWVARVYKPEECQ